MSNDGRVFSIRTQCYLRPSSDKDGYLYYVLCVCGYRRTIKAHRLVADAFVPNPQKKPTVDHINGIRADNRAQNLRWATHHEQWMNPVSIERHKVGAIAAADKIRGLPSTKKKPVYATKDGVTVLFTSLAEACEYLSVNPGHASECANGKRATANGYSFSWYDKLPTQNL